MHARQASRQRRHRAISLRGRAASVLAAATLLAALAPPAAQAALTTETININWGVTTPEPSSSPFRGLGSGTFTASGVINDSGVLAGAVQDVAVPSPTKGINQISPTLTSDAGSLNLRCTNTATDFSDPTAIPGTGPCTITGGGTGVYADLQGHGTMSGIIDGLTRSQTATIELSIA